MDPLFWQLLLQLFLIFLNAVFACAEIAVLSVNDSKLEALSKNGDKKALRLLRLTNEPARFLATIQVAITLSGFLGSAFAADNFAARLVTVFAGTGIPEDTLNTICVILITLILSYFTLVFGELVPKRLAMKNAESLALRLSGTVSFISRAFSPIVSALTASTNFILRLLHIDPASDDETATEEDILLMVNQSSRNGKIDTAEELFINNIFAFDDITVEEFATHRTNVAILWTDETAAEWENTIRATKHSKYVVCDTSVDNVIGIISVKDYYMADDRSVSALIKTSVKPPLFVPIGINAEVLFQKMKEVHTHFAVVLDEYGGMFGIVTMYDLLEQLVGDFDDFDDPDTDIPEEPEIEKIDENTWKIRGTAMLDDIKKKLNVDFDEGEYDTFGGLVFGTHGTVPKDGTELEIVIPPLYICVKSIKSHRIVYALVSKIQNENTSNNQTQA